MSEFFLELLQEDIPARMQLRAAEDLQRLITEKLTEAGLTFERAHATSSPRRLALQIVGLPARQPDKNVERKGPRVGSPDGAIQGFLKAAGLASLDEAEQRGEFWFASKSVQGRPTTEVLTELVPAALRELPWPKSMRWGETRVAWVRPLVSIIALFDGAIVPLSFELGADRVLTAGDTTRGHRFLAPEPFGVTSFADYVAKLKAAKVLVERSERMREIIRQLNEKTDAEGLLVESDDALMQEVAGLVEWPVVLLASIDQSFMDLPVEVRRTTMRANQKYFTLHDRDGKAAPRFALVANMETTDGGKSVVAGNERVLRARLADARFFWDQDRKRKLETRYDDLASVTFHAKLGTMRDKAERMQALAEKLSSACKADPLSARKAAKLAKTDLTTGMVGEFPELQGIIGRYYLLGETNSGAAPTSEQAHRVGPLEEIADAIAAHYRPLGPGDQCPTAPVSVAVALADKLDTLAGFFAIGETPTGSKDPFALRRAALGAIRLIIENSLRLHLRDAFDAALALHGRKDPAITQQLLDFFADRLKVTLKEQGARHDLIDAVFALGNEDDLVRVLARVRALQDFLGTTDGTNLLAAFKRATNIVRIEEKKDGVTYDQAPSADAYVQDEERALGAALEAATTRIEPVLASEDYVGAMRALSELRGAVDVFFDRVTVNADESAVRANRLRLLSRLRAVLTKVADFTEIQGG
ncbi:glycine--tRNA ligase subunit beta [Roseiterribacter gracilis]|uniref:Glycine--tRNA ligase beta subunit n=1 Tax=Roseiterribacter gracilis TaxID=2812848 RepID=A0A8S8XAD9_9PROT|nr:glycine--tRNA ligase beta subunit [Rhodospirillales bacterium TMPK1]